MSYVNNATAWIIALIGSGYAFITGSTSLAFQILLVVMVLDVVSGFMKGIKYKRLKSAIMHMGIMKKAGMLLAIVFAFTLDRLLNQGQPVFSTMMTWLSIGNEGLSVTENLTALDVKLPKAITDKLAVVIKEMGENQDLKDK